MSSSKRSHQMAMGGKAGPVEPPAKNFKEYNEKYAIHKFGFRAELNSTWPYQTKKFIFPPGQFVELIICKEDPLPVKRKGRVATSLGLECGPSTWLGDEKSRLDVRFHGVDPTYAAWELLVDMWGTPEKGGDKIHLRTLIDTDDASPRKDDVGWMVTTYFTVTEQETEQNSGADELDDFHFTVRMKGTQK
jgi:hypothetical protein